MSRTPQWFTDAIAQPGESHRLTVAGAGIHYLKWSDSPARPGLVLVHGGAAHAHWWDMIAPLLTERLQIAAIDLSGMGDSDHRTHYSHDLYADELLAVAEHAGFYATDPAINPFICGHSLGGFMTFRTAHRYPQKFSGIVVLDSPVPAPDAEYPSDWPERPLRIYPDLATALSRFRLIPDQPCANDFILDHIARHSLKPYQQGYIWKYDYQFFSKLGGMPARQKDIADIPIPAHYVYGADSALITPDILNYMQQQFGPKVAVSELANACHHLLLDQPLALVELLKSIIHQWLDAK